MQRACMHRLKKMFGGRAEREVASPHLDIDFTIALARDLITFDYSSCKSIRLE
jgi:hypothetical protein